MNVRNLLRAIPVAALLASVTVCTAQTGSLRAGAAKSDISPSQDMYPLSGGQLYGSLHDPLFARALVLDNGTAKTVLLTVDATQVPYGDDLAKTITAEIGVPAERIFMSATHDHNAPASANRQDPSAPPPPYYAIVKKGVLEAVRQANSKLQPARIGYGTGKAYINTNRDEKIGAGYHMGYVPEGPSDKTVAVLSVTTQAGDPLAVYINYPVHAVVMYRAKTKDGHVQVTGDIAGATSAYVEERFKNAVALWTSGAAGDQNPQYMATYNQDHPDVFDEGPGGYAILDVQARRLGQEVVRVASAIQNSTDKAVLWAKKTAVTCPGQRRAEPPKPGTPSGGYLAPVDVKMVDGNPVNIPLHLLMINDIAMAGVAGEVFTEIGMHLKRDSLFDRTFMVTVMPNGIGYVPTDAAFLLPAEKALTNSLKPGCAEPAMIGGFQSMMKEYLSVWKAAQR